MRARLVSAHPAQRQTAPVLFWGRGRRLKIAAGLAELRCVGLRFPRAPQTKPVKRRRVWGRAGRF